MHNTTRLDSGGNDRPRMGVPLVALLHAWPLDTLDSSLSTNTNGNEDDPDVQGNVRDPFAPNQLNSFVTTEDDEQESEVPDVERELERQDAFKALVDARLTVTLKCLPLNTETLVEALRTAHVVLLGAHGTLDGGILLEKGMGGAEYANAASLEAILTGMGGSITTRLVFVSACYSKSIGKMLSEVLGIDHVVCIAEDDRVSNFVSRAFFGALLQACLRGSPVEDSVEESLKFVETHRELPLERQLRQRKKFVYFQSSTARSHLFDPDDLSRSGLPQDLTETSSMFGFRRTEMPKPIFGRNSLIKLLAEKVYSSSSSEENCVFLVQDEPGLGSSLVVHAVCRFLADRTAFDTIKLCESYGQARQHLMMTMEQSTKDADPYLGLEGDSSSSRALIVIDPANWVEESADEAWVFDRLIQETQQRVLRSRMSVLVVAKMSNAKVATRVNELKNTNPDSLIPIEPLIRKGVEAFKAFLIEQLRLPTHHLLTSVISANGRATLEGNPRRILAWAKSVCLDQPEHAERLRDATARTWLSNLQQIAQDCVVGPVTLWTRRERRTIITAEAEWIKSVCDQFASVTEFWIQWLKPTLATLGAIEPFFTNGSVIGFVSEAHTRDVALKGKEAGSFLWRCSEKAPGQITLSFIAPPDPSVTPKKPAFLGKASITVNGDGSVMLPLDQGNRTVCRDLHEAIMSMKKLKRVVVSRDGMEVMDKEAAFNDLF